ncbi:MAG TPA: hypothetical protein PLW78_13065 [bacterium]|nr:hypothetical protein [bacterium]
MKKILVFLTAMFMFAGLFGEEIKIDEKTAEDLNRLAEAYSSLGIEMEMILADPDKISKDEAMSIDEVIANIEGLIQIKSLPADCEGNLAVLKIYERVTTPSGFIYAWLGKISSYLGSMGDWDGSMHWLVTSGGQSSSIKTVSGPSVQYNSSEYSGYRWAKARFIENGLVYVPGIGYVIMPINFGPIKCYDLNNL